MDKYQQLDEMCEFKLQALWEDTNKGRVDRGYKILGPQGDIEGRYSPGQLDVAWFELYRLVSDNTAKSLKKVGTFSLWEMVVDGVKCFVVKVGNKSHCFPNQKEAEKFFKAVIEKAEQEQKQESDEKPEDRGGPKP